MQCVLRDCGMVKSPIFENEAAPVEPKTSPRMRSLQGLACLKLRPSRHIEKRSSGEARLELDSSTTGT
jgi:hypothetical protein